MLLRTSYRLCFSDHQAHDAVIDAPGALVEEPERTCLAETNNTDVRSLHDRIVHLSCSVGAARWPESAELGQPGRPPAPGLRVNEHGFSLLRRCAGPPTSVKNWNSSAAISPGPAMANEWLKRNRAGEIVLQLKSPYQDGHHPYRYGAAGVHGAPSGCGAAAASPSERFHGRAGGQDEVAQSNRSRSGRARP